MPLASAPPVRAMTRMRITLDTKCREGQNPGQNPAQAAAWPLKPDGRDVLLAIPTPKLSPLAATVTLGPAPARMLAPLARSWRSSAIGALLVSVALHGAVGTAALLSPVPELRGGGGQAIGDEMILVPEAAALDNAVPTLRTGAASAAARAETDGEANAVPVPQPAVRQTAIAEPVRPPADAEGAAPIAPATRQPTAQPPAAVGGHTAVALAETAAQPAAAAAHAGALERYRNEVQQALVRHPPKGTLTSGTTEPAIVTIEFSLTVSGQVEDVQLVKASRSEKLNRLLTAWISAAQLPVPPAGLTAAERRFSFPFTIR